MIRNAATRGVTPVPSRLRAARTGGRVGGAGWSAMGKAAGLGVIPRYVTAFNAFEWDQKKGALTRIRHQSSHPGQGSRNRQSSNSRLGSTCGRSCKSGEVCSAEEGQSGGSRTYLRKEGEFPRSRGSSSWKNLPSDQYQFSLLDEGQLFPDLSEKCNVNTVALSTHQQPLTEG